MKKLLYFLFLSLSINLHSSGQCTPDTTLSGPDIIFPPAGSATYNVNGEEIVVLPHATAGVNYDQTLQFRVPKDTSFGGLNATIDYIKVIAVLNLPGNLSTTCNPSNCTFPGGSYGCARLQGLPGSADSLQIPVAVELKFTNGSNTVVTNDTLRNIYLVVNGTIGLEKPVIDDGLKIRFYPNPADDIGFLTYTTSAGGNTEVKITNVIGNNVFKRTYEAASGENRIKLNLSNLSAGIYLYSVKNGAETRSGRFIITR